MTEISKYNQFINEICSFEWERTILDRNDEEHKYLDANYEPIPLLRLPKYNQLNGDYEKFITTLRSDAYNEILLFENFKIEKVLYRLQEIEIEFNELWKVWTEILTSLAKTKKEFDYSEVVSQMYVKFKIIDFNTNAYFYDGFNGSFGLITDEFKSDLYDALLLKDGELHHLIYDLKNYLKSFEMPVPASNETKTVIFKHIEHLKGVNLLKDKIMSDENFERLFRDLCYLVEENALPAFEKPLPQIGVSNQSLIYTFRLIHIELFTTKKIRESFIDFLQEYFSQLSDIEQMKVAFSKKPPKNYPF